MGKLRLDGDVIGYGTYPNKEALVDIIDDVVAYGYLVIDTSDNYYNEQYIGEGLKNVKDDRICITTKFSQPERTMQLAQCFIESSYKLKNRINLYLLHWPYPFLWKVQWRKMEKLVLEGKCDAIGVCNFDSAHIKRLLSFCKIPPAVNQIECHPLFQQQDVENICRDNGIKIMCYSPFARINENLFHNSVLKDISEKYKKNVAQIILRWDVQKGRIPLPATISINHLKENISIFDFELTDEEIAQIDSLESGLRVRYDPQKRFTLKEKIFFLVYRIRIILRLKK